MNQNNSLDEVFNKPLSQLSRRKVKRNKYKEKQKEQKQYEKINKNLNEQFQNKLSKIVDKNCFITNLRLVVTIRE